jgi:class 3 adenylate cyclase
MFAASHPERTIALIGWAASARSLWAADYPWATSETAYDEEMREVERLWGTEELARDWTGYVMPDFVHDEAFIRRFAAWMRAIGGPGDAATLYEADRESDIRRILPVIRVPTLVVHRTNDRALSVEHGRFVASHIPGASMVELEGTVHAWLESPDFLDEVERFVRELQQEAAEYDRVLATVLFTDIVGSTGVAAERGDRAWGELLEQHHATMRGLLARHRGREIDTAGDGFFATFDGPARAVRCAQAATEAVRPLGIEIRAGVHTGEVETVDDKVAGMAVNIGARMGALAGPSQVFASQTVKDLVAGSGLAFEDAGDHELRGVPGTWRVYRVQT